MRRGSSWSAKTSRCDGNTCEEVITATSIVSCAYNWSLLLKFVLLGNAACRPGVDYEYLCTVLYPDLVIPHRYFVITILTSAQCILALRFLQFVIASAPVFSCIHTQRTLITRWHRSRICHILAWATRSPRTIFETRLLRRSA